MSYSKEELQHLVRAIPIAEWHKLVPAILRGNYTLPGGNPESRPADALAGLLRDDAIPIDVRNKVVEGCRALYIPLSKILRKRPIEITVANRRFAENYCSVLQHGLPFELADDARGLLSLAESEFVPADFRSFFVAAAVALASTAAHREFWAAHVEGTLFPTQALTALIRTNPKHLLVQKGLISIWRRVLRGELRAQMPLFVRQALIGRGEILENGRLNIRGKLWLRVILLKVADNHGDRIAAVAGQLERFTWSKEWVNLLPSGRLTNPETIEFEAIVSSAAEQWDPGSKVVELPQYAPALLHPENVEIITNTFPYKHQSELSLTVTLSSDDEEAERAVNEELQIVRKRLCKMPRLPSAAHTGAPQ